jgi:tetratricopeptide (TPR) repeat protein
MSGTIEPIILEEHSSVLAEWWKRRFENKTLVYLDAHLDLQYVSTARMARLRGARSLRALADLEKPDHLAPDGDYVYGLENFLYPASQLGIVEHLVWVAPPHVDVGYTRRAIEYAQQMDGVDFDEITQFKRTGHGCLSGRLLGLRLTICGLDQLGALDVPDGSLLDIDTDFFVALPADHPWIEPAAVHAQLTRSVPAPALVTIARSVGSGFMPLRYRYFADALSSAWRGQEPEAQHYADLLSLERRLAEGDHDGVATATAAELASFPNCPATLHLRARALFGPNAFSDEAARLSPAYRDDPVRLASATANRHLATSLARLDELRSKLASSGPGESAHAIVAFGLAYAARGAPAEALACYREYGSPHPQLALAIAGLLASSSDRQLRRELLSVAALEDSSATSAHMQLAELAIQARDLPLARDHARRAQANAPAWTEALKLVAWIDERLGDASSARAHLDEITRRTRVLERLFGAAD